MPDYPKGDFESYSKDYPKDVFEDYPKDHLKSDFEDYPKDHLKGEFEGYLRDHPKGDPKDQSEGNFQEKRTSKRPPKGGPQRGLQKRPQNSLRS
jgi:hypothetical protein